MEFKKNTVLGEDILADIGNLLEKRTGLLLKLESKTAYRKTLERFLEETQAKTSGQLIDLLKISNGELQKLVNRLTIGESYFFRNRPQFEALHKIIIPRLISEVKESRKLFIWCAGCAKGEEPYSIAILLHKHFPQLADWDVSIWATDINSDFLTKAQQAVYSSWSLRGLDEKDRETYFTRDAKGEYRLRDEIAGRVVFRHHNLAEYPYNQYLSYNKVDLLFCRNVFIYFSYNRIQEIISAFERVVRPNGYLILGHSETVATKSRFDVVYSNATHYYRRCDETKRVSLEKRKPRTSLPIPGIGRNSMLPSGSTVSVEVVSFPPISPLPSFTAVEESKALPQSVGETRDRMAAHLAAARDYADRGQMRNAFNILDELLNDGNALDYHVHFLYALVADQLGKTQQAMNALKQAIFLNKEFVIGHFFLGVIYEREERIETAKRYFRNVWKLIDKMKDDCRIEDTEDLTVEQLKKITEARLKELQF